MRVGAKETGTSHDALTLVFLKQADKTIEEADPRELRTLVLGWMPKTPRLRRMLKRKL